MPEISVLIPIYNVSKYIDQCLRSVLCNSCIDKAEIILVNDCSTDNSMVIAKQVCAEYPRISVKFLEHEKNRGLAAARNTLLAAASGKYIVCVDSDDWVEPDYLENLYQTAEQNQADIVLCDSYQNERHYQKSVKGPFPKETESIVCALFAGDIQWWIWTKFIRRDLFIQHAIRWTEHLDFMEDLLTSIRICHIAKTFAYIPKPLYHYRTTPASLTFTLNQNKIEQGLGVIRELGRFVQEAKNSKYATSLNFLKLERRVSFALRGPENFRKSAMLLYPEANRYIPAFIYETKQGKKKKAILGAQYISLSLALRFVKRWKTETTARKLDAARDIDKTPGEN